MAIRLKRTLPPAAAPLRLRDIRAGFGGFLAPEKTVRDFEEEVRNFFGVRYCFTVSNGKAALFLILQALQELFPGKNEVLLPAYTCYSVPSAVVRAGLRVRLCDLAPGRLDFDFALLEQEFENPKLLCVIPTHLYGLPADVTRIKVLASSRGVTVVEDAAQAIGAEWGETRAGAVGDAGFFSLGRGKVISTVEGGVIVTDDERLGAAIGKRFDALGDYGFRPCAGLVLYALALTVLIHPRLFWLPKGLPFLKLGETLFDPAFPVRKMSSFQAGMAKGWRRRIASLQSKRLKNVRAIWGHGVAPPGMEPDEAVNLIRFPVLVADPQKKQKILKESERLGLGIAAGYPDSVDGIAQLRDLFSGKTFPRAKEISEKIISLPVHPFVREKDIQRMVQLLR